jgi:hypothetical protein
LTLASGWVWVAPPVPSSGAVGWSAGFVRRLGLGRRGVGIRLAAQCGVPRFGGHPSIEQAIGGG